MCFAEMSFVTSAFTRVRIAASASGVNGICFPFGSFGSCADCVKSTCRSASSVSGRTCWVRLYSVSGPPVSARR